MAQILMARLGILSGTRMLWLLIPGDLTTAVPSITANNFRGNLIIANSSIENSYVNLAGSTPANVLMLADSF